MSKTIREWLEQLPEPDRSQAIGQTSEARLEERAFSLIEAVYAMFNWCGSCEGLEHWKSLSKRVLAGEFDRPAEQPTAFPDELSVARANITKLVAENARLEREVERAKREIKDMRDWIWNHGRMA